MRNTKRNTKSIWVERLSLPVVVILLLKRLCSNIIVRYDENRISTLAKLVLSLLKTLNIIKASFAPAHLTLSKKGKTGNALKCEIMANLKICVESLIENYIPCKSERFKNMTKSYLSTRLVDAMEFITMVESTKDFQKDEDVIYLSLNILNSFINQLYKNGQYRFQQPPISIKYVYFFLKPPLFIGVFLILKLLPYKVKNNIGRIRPAIWIEETGGGIDYAFFLNHLRVKDYDIVYYFDRKETLVDDESIRVKKEEGVKCIDMHFLSLIKLANIRINDLLKLCRKSFDDFSKYPLWFCIFLFEYRVLYELYRSVYLGFQVKMLLQHQETSWLQEAQSSALESVGGIMIGMHWSSFVYFEPLHLYPQHVYFVWDKVNFEFIQKIGNSCRYILPCGLWILPSLEKIEEVNNLSKNVEFVIAVFDTGAGYRLLRSVYDLSEFYLRTLNVLEKCEYMGGIVKSKKMELEDLCALPKGNEIVGRMGKLIEGRRLVFLNRETCPATTAIHADLCVCMGINSAGIISGVHGVNTIFWDTASLINHPMYLNQDEWGLYTSPEEFENAIVKASQGDKLIGDSSEWKKRYMYFDDFKSHERVGKFIQAFMENVVESGDANSALDLTVGEYLKENDIGDDFYELDNYWNDETDD